MLACHPEFTDTDCDYPVGLVADAAPGGRSSHLFTAAHPLPGSNGGFRHIDLKLFVFLVLVVMHYTVLVPYRARRSHLFPWCHFRCTHWAQTPLGVRHADVAEDSFPWCLVPPGSEVPGSVRGLQGEDGEQREGKGRGREGRCRRTPWCFERRKVETSKEKTAKGRVLNIHILPEQVIGFSTKGENLGCIVPT